MAVAVRDIELITIEPSDRSDTYRFERTGDEFPYVDVSVLRQAVHERRRIVTDGPFRLEPTSAKARSYFRVRPQVSPRSEFSVSMADDRLEEVAGWIANLVFEINDNSKAHEQDQY